MMRLMRQSGVALFFAVVALCLLPVASAFACGPCLDEYCDSSRAEHSRAASQLNPFAAVLPADRAQPADDSPVLRAPEASAVVFSPKPTRPPMRI